MKKGSAAYSDVAKEAQACPRPPFWSYELRERSLKDVVPVFTRMPVEELVNYG